MGFYGEKALNYAKAKPYHVGGVAAAIVTPFLLWKFLPAGVMNKVKGWLGRIPFIKNLKCVNNTTSSKQSISHGEQGACCNGKDQAPALLQNQKALSPKETKDQYGLDPCGKCGGREGKGRAGCGRCQKCFGIGFKINPKTLPKDLPIVECTKCDGKGRCGWFSWCNRCQGWGELHPMPCRTLVTPKSGEQHEDGKCTKCCNGSGIKYKAGPRGTCRECKGAKSCNVCKAKGTSQGLVDRRKTLEAAAAERKARQRRKRRSRKRRSRNRRSRKGSPSPNPK